MHISLHAAHRYHPPPPSPCQSEQEVELWGYRSRLWTPMNVEGLPLIVFLSCVWSSMYCHSHNQTDSACEIGLARFVRFTQTRTIPSDVKLPSQRNAHIASHSNCIDSIRGPNFAHFPLSWKQISNCSKSSVVRPSLAVLEWASSNFP